MSNPPGTTSAPARRSRYVYRTTTDKLLAVIEHVESSGDEVLSEHFVGGRDWHLICRPAPTGGR